MTYFCCILQYLRRPWGGKGPAPVVSPPKPALLWLWWNDLSSSVSSYWLIFMLTIWSGKPECALIPAQLGWTNVQKSLSMEPFLIALARVYSCCFFPGIHEENVNVFFPQATCKLGWYIKWSRILGFKCSILSWWYTFCFQVLRIFNCLITEKNTIFKGRWIIKIKCAVGSVMK